jgi:hypothetical protein
LRAWVVARSSESQLFLRLLIHNARRAEPPLIPIRAESFRQARQLQALFEQFIAH